MNDCSFYLAPIRGITDRVYRNCLAEVYPGIDCAITPFVQTVRGNQVKASQLEENDPAQNRLPIIPQIIGHNPQQFLDLAQQLIARGNNAVNWNLGCPYPTMTKRRKGAGLLPLPDDIDRFLDLVCSRLSVPLSIKMRLGLRTARESLALAPILNRYPLQHITLHPRTGIQMYDGSVDLDSFVQCCIQLQHPVIYSGDINTLDDYRRLSQNFPNIKAWMLGRGLLRHPHLLQEIQQDEYIRPGETTKQLRLFHELLMEHYLRRLSGPTHQLQRLTDHWSYWCQGLPQGELHFKRVRRCKTIAKYRSEVDKILNV